MSTLTISVNVFGFFFRSNCMWVVRQTQMKEIQFKDAHTQILVSYKCPEIARVQHKPMQFIQEWAAWSPHGTHSLCAVRPPGPLSWLPSWGELDQDSCAQLPMLSPLQRASLLEVTRKQDHQPAFSPFPVSTSHPRVPLFLVLPGAPSKLEISTLPPELWLFSWHVEERGHHSHREDSKAKSKILFLNQVVLTHWSSQPLSLGWMAFNAPAEEKAGNGKHFGNASIRAVLAGDPKLSLVESLPKGLLDLQGFSELCGCKAKSLDTRADRKICLRIFASLCCSNPNQF